MNIPPEPAIDKILNEIDAVNDILKTKLKLTRPQAEYLRGRKEGLEIALVYLEEERYHEPG